MNFLQGEQYHIGTDREALIDVEMVVERRREQRDDLSDWLRDYRRLRRIAASETCLPSFLLSVAVSVGWLLRACFCLCADRCMKSNLRMHAVRARLRGEFQRTCIDPVAFVLNEATFEHATASSDIQVQRLCPILQRCVDSLGTRITSSNS